MNPYRIDSIRSPHARKSKTVIDSDSGFFSVELGFLIPIVSGIPDSLSCVPYSKAQDSGFLIFFVSGTQSLVGLRILSGLHTQNFPDCGPQIPLRRVMQFLFLIHRIISFFNWRILIYFQKGLLCIGTFERSIPNINMTVENSEHDHVYSKTLRGFAPVLYSAGFCISALFSPRSRSVISNVTLM